MKEIIRTQGSFRKSGIRKLPKLNQSVMSNNKSTIKVEELNSSKYQSDAGARSRSIDPKRVKLRSKPRIETIKKSKLIDRNLQNVTPKINKSSEFEKEFAEASKTKVSVVTTDTATLISDVPSKNILLKKMFQEMQEKDETPSNKDFETEPVFDKSKGVTFAPDTEVKHPKTLTPGQNDDSSEGNNDNFENLGGNISFMDMN